jgi:hypothetical protein
MQSVNTMSDLPGFAILFACLASVAGPGCPPERSDTPVGAYLDLAKALQKGDWKTAYARLSTPTQQILQERAKEISSASGGAINTDPMVLFFASAPKPQPVTEVKLVKEGGGAATVRAASGKWDRDIPMVRESTGWKVDLSGWIDARAPSGNSR